MGGYMHEAGKPLDQPVDVWFGQIAEDATDFNDKVMVVLPDFLEDRQLGPCFWQSRNDVDLPQRGHRCIVMFDNRQQPWVIAWWPFDI